MDQITKFPACRTAVALDRRRGVLLTAIRWWVDAGHRDEVPWPRASLALETAGIGQAAVPIGAPMALVTGSVQRPATVGSSGDPTLSVDRTYRRPAAALGWADKTGLVDKTLRIALLSAHDAGVVLCPPRELGALLAEVGWFFRGRRPVEHPAPAGAVHPWVPTPIPDPID